MKNMKSQLSNAKAAVSAGVLISIAAMAFVKVGGALGTVLFSVGLIGTFLLGGKLCTGMFGYVRSAKSAMNALIALVINAGTAYICGLLYKQCCGEVAVISSKMLKPLYHVLFSGVVCGVLIYMAVEGWRSTGQLLAVIVPVAAFVGIGAEHCVADAFYIGAGNFAGIKEIIWWLCSVAGNMVGGLMVGFLKMEVKHSQPGMKG